MFRPMIVATMAFVLAGCAGGGGGPQSIQTGRGADVPAAQPAGPHSLANAETTAVRGALASQVRSPQFGTTVAHRDAAGVVTVCGLVSGRDANGSALQNAPYIGILTSQGRGVSFSVAGLGSSEVEARAVRTICGESSLRV